MRSLLVMWNPYPQAPEVSIVRTDTCMPPVHAKYKRLPHTSTMPNDGTERCGRPTASELATDLARPHSLQ
jgi:hypothetical protein